MKKGSVKALVVTLIILIGIFIFFLVNKTAVIDTFKGIGYNPTPDMLSVKEAIGLTSEGERIFNATRPLLASREDFNASCESHDSEISVLGCYAGDRVYIFNVSDSTLAGIRESTAAHEFLHAVWSRLPGIEKNELVPLLEQTYSTHPEMRDTINSYTQEEQIGELYVRLATQVKDLPDVLETHYAKYFKDQDSVVKFYDSYIAPFNKLNDEIEQLQKELSDLEEDINTRSEELESRLTSFKKQVDEFNNCAATAGCFSSNWAFNARRAELVSEQQAINAENDFINELITSYNNKADKYNNSIARSTDLQNLINSNYVENVIEDE